MDASFEGKEVVKLDEVVMFVVRLNSLRREQVCQGWSWWLRLGLWSGLELGLRVGITGRTGKGIVTVVQPRSAVGLGRRSDGEARRAPRRHAG